ncbi:Ca(2+)-dependent cysteine protease [Mortierella sp. AD011]|nr:Ca(2+)-dependent cysteine protease [Mortierella sp. AD010]KAF9391983.1 Ca(2+)-dependent cysteine protease [Mortierella sp. AD011]
MSQQEVGEPIVNVEKVVTVMPDGRKVIKTIKKITHSYQVQVPAGTPLPEGAHLVSSVPAEVSPPTKTVTYQESSTPAGYSSQSYQQYNTGNAVPTVVVESSVDGDGRKVTKTTTTTSSSSSGPLLNNAGLFPQGETFTNTTPAVVVQSSVDENGRKVTKTTTTTTTSGTGAFPQGESLANSTPTVVVESTVDGNGRKVTKTTTTTSSGSQGPFSKLFKRFSQRNSKDSKGSSNEQPKPKPSPTIAVAPLAVPQTKVNRTKTEPPRPKPIEEQPPTSKKSYVKTFEAKDADGTKFALSDCTGHRRALLIGINYRGLHNELHGCVNDTVVMKKFLLENKFKEENIRILTDDQVGTQWMPTKANIMRNLEWLIHDAKKNDSYFLHYSGHGGQVADLDGDETDGMDNCIFPLDHAQNGVIVDDELHNMLVKSLPQGVRLTVVFDCCHSGSALDLPYMYASTGYIRGSNALANLGHELVQGNFDAEAVKELQLKWQKLQLEEKEFNRQVNLKAAKADVIMFSGCKDDQTSADISITKGGRSSSNGAMTYAFTKCIRETPLQSYQEMLNNIRDLLKDKYRQRPQLSSSRPMNMQELFHM